MILQDFSKQQRNVNADRLQIQKATKEILSLSYSATSNTI